MEITVDHISAFRQKYKEFGDTTCWSDTTVLDALIEGDTETGSNRWGGYEDDPHNFKQRGMFTFAAHYILALFPQGDHTMTGTSKFAVSSRSVGDESEAYNMGDLANLSVGDSWLATTSFGQMFMRLRKRAGRCAGVV